MCPLLDRLILVFLILSCLTGSAAAQRRPALVIGNASYVSAAKLKNPRNDATAIARSLRDLGFSVTLALDLDKAGFEQQVRSFADSLDGATAAVLFYAGHGLQVDGRNYMVPVDAQVANEADLPFELVSLDIVLQRLAGHRSHQYCHLGCVPRQPAWRQTFKGFGRTRECRRSMVWPMFMPARAR